MPKNIILCSDGTGNTAVKGRGTNVFKLFEAVDLNEYRTNPALDAQLAFYDDGVGTQGVELIKLFGGAAGLGLARNVRKLYRELSRVYDPGDRIFLFGFSRGAFTVRTLAGMIGRCGVLRGESFTTARALTTAVDDAYATYRAAYQSTLTRWIGRMAGRETSADGALAKFARKYTPHSDVRIAFIGVWDTVDAVGMPFALAETWNRRIVQFKFPGQTLGQHVDHACHALSIDDDRRAFEPVLWQVPPGDDRIEQVWFAGVHSNIGGGYPKQGMSLVALDWMLCHAAEHGLRLQPLDHDMFRGHASVDDMLYDPRAGLGLFYRWAPRDVRKYCKDSGIPPRIHVTVAERIAHGTDSYAPGNIPPEASITITPPLRREADWENKQRVLAGRASAVEAAIRQAHARGGYLLDRVRRDIARGDQSYWMFMVAWLLVVVQLAGLAVWAMWFVMRWVGLVEFVTKWSGLVARVVAWVEGVHISIWWPGSLFVATMLLFVATWFVAKLVDDRIDDTFSEFWQRHQKELRAALKDAHKRAREADDPPPPDDSNGHPGGPRIDVR